MTELLGCLVYSLRTDREIRERYMKSKPPSTKKNHFNTIFESEESQRRFYEISDIEVIEDVSSSIES